MNYKFLKMCCFLLAVILLVVMACYIIISTYTLWKHGEYKFSAENYSYFELLFARQKGAIGITLFSATALIILGIYFNFKSKRL